MTEIPKLVVELTMWTSDDEGHEGEPLLRQLRRAVWGDAGGTKAGASSGAPIPIDAGAAILWEEIAEEIATQYAAATELRPNPAPVVNLLAWLAAYSAAETTVDQDAVALARLQGWAKRIRDYFSPPRVRELMVACPNCGYKRITLGEGELEKEVFALVSSVRDGEVTVSCRNPLCLDAFAEPSEWRGEEMLTELGRRTGNPISAKALRAALRVPTDEPIETDREITAFDPLRPPVDAADLRTARIERFLKTWLNTPSGRAGDYLALRRFIEKRLGRPIATDEQASLVGALAAEGALASSTSISSESGDAQ